MGPRPSRRAATGTGTGTGGSRPDVEHQAPPKSPLREQSGPPDPLHHRAAFFPGAAGGGDRGCYGCRCREGMRGAPGERRKQRSGFPGSRSSLTWTSRARRRRPASCRRGGRCPGAHSCRRPPRPCGQRLPPRRLTSRRPPAPSLPPSPAGLRPRVSASRRPRPPCREVPPGAGPGLRLRAAWNPRDSRGAGAGPWRGRSPPPAPANRAVLLVPSPPVITDTYIGHSEQGKGMEQGLSSCSHPWAGIRSLLPQLSRVCRQKSPCFCFLRIRSEYGIRFRR